MNNKNNLIIKNINYLDNDMDKNSLWYKQNNIEKKINETDQVGFYKNKLLDQAMSESTVQSNMHIYEKWRDFLWDKLMPRLCNLKNDHNIDCINCPSRNQHVNYSLKVLNMTSKQWFAARYTKGLNIARKISNEEMRELYREFINYYRTTPKKTGEMRSPNTIITYIKQIKRWQKVINKECGTDFDFADDIKVKEITNTLEPIPPEDLNQLTKTILNNSEQLTTNKLTAKRLKAVYFLILQTGLRLNEVCELNKNNFNVLPDYTGQLKVKGKGSKERIVGLSQETVMLIQDYLKERNIKVIDTEPALFINQNFERMARNSIIGMFKRISKKTGIKFSAHALRRTSASLFVFDGADTLDLMNNFGWESESVAKRYIKAAKNLESVEKQKSFNPYVANQKLLEKP